MMRYSISGLTADEVRQAGGSSIKDTKTLHVVFAEMSEEQAEQLRRQGASISKVNKVTLNTSPPLPVEAEPIYTPQRLAEAAGFELMREYTEPHLTGKGFTVAVLDTGVRTTHDILNGRVVKSLNFSGSSLGDGFNHGTGVASVVLAMAPQCNLVDVKVINDNGEGDTEMAALAIDELLSMHDENDPYAPWVINLSIGAIDDGNYNEPLRIACREAMSRGLWVVAAAGNGGPYERSITNPGCERHVACVGSCSYEPFSVSSFSSRGPTIEGHVKPDVLFFGENIIVASSGSDSSTIAKSGTSFSTPFMSGLAILYFEAILAYGGVKYPEGPPPGILPEVTSLLTEQEVMDNYASGFCIKPEGVPSPSGVKDNESGWGIPFGSLVAESIAAGAAPAIGDISSLIGMMMTMMMMGMMMKSMTGVSE